VGAVRKLGLACKFTGFANRNRFLRPTGNISVAAPWLDGWEDRRHGSLLRLLFTSPFGRRWVRLFAAVAASTQKDVELLVRRRHLPRRFAGAQTA
jgi:hypothetical protein